MVSIDCDCHTGTIIIIIEGYYMGWRFRKILNSGPIRTTLSKRGLGFSMGLPGFRVGISPDGRKYVSVGIPKTGLYWIKYFSNSTNKSSINTGQQQLSNTGTINQTNPTVSSQNPATKIVNTPWWRQKGFK